MQTHDSNNQCPAQESTDGRRDAERSTVEAADRLASEGVPDADNRTVCLSAKLIGSGKAAG